MSPPISANTSPLRLSALTDPSFEVSPIALGHINGFLFPSYAPLPAQVDACLILGSRNCGYRVAAALNYHPQQPIHYIVSGGGLIENGATEADFMAAKLTNEGIAPEHILIESSSRCTVDNLRHARNLFPALPVEQSDLRLILVTAGFHLRRTLTLAQSVFSDLPRLQIFPLPAYGPHTSPDNWHRNEMGRRIIADELAKLNTMGLLPDDLHLVAD